jgi:osmoprotectant transport system substrate-binding protein
MKTITTRVHAAIAIALVLALALSIAACGSSHDNSSVTLTIATPGYPEEPKILGEIYAQALEKAGYEVSPQLALESETKAKVDLQRSVISAYPLSIKLALIYLGGVEREDVPTSESEALKELEAYLEKSSLVALPPTPYANPYTVGTTRKLADKLGLKDISSLQGKSKSLVFSGPLECSELVECTPGLKKFYGLEFKSFVPKYLGSQYEVLESGQADLSMLHAAEAPLAGKSNFVILEDDKHALPAGSKTVLLTSQDTVEEAGTDFQTAVVDAQRGLTLPVMRRLNAEVELEGKTPKAVARSYLQEQQQ